MLYTLYAQGENWRDHKELDATPHSIPQNARLHRNRHATVQSN
jgi:hypothetical protein